MTSHDPRIAVTSIRAASRVRATVARRPRAPTSGLLAYPSPSRAIVIERQVRPQVAQVVRDALMPTVQDARPRWR